MQSRLTVRPKTFFCLALFCAALSAGAQPTNSTVRALSLKECIDLALQRNLDVQIAIESPIIAGHFLSAAYGLAYDPILSVTAQRTVFNQPTVFDKKALDNDPIRVPALGAFKVDFPYELTTDSVGPGLTGRLPTGLSYNLAARVDAVSTISSFPSPQFLYNPAFPAVPNSSRTNGYLTTVALTLRQPLLKDSWIDLYRRNIQVSRKDLKISELALRFRIMDVVTRVQLAYYDLLFSREQITVEKKALELATQLFSETRRRVEVGQLPPLDEKQAESRVETLQSDLSTALEAFAVQQNNLKNLLTDSFQGWAYIDVQPTDALTALEEPHDRVTSWTLALQNRPDLAQLRVDLEKQDIHVRFAYNQLFPGLDAFGSYGWQAFDVNFDHSLDGVGRGTHPVYSAGIALNFPLSNTAARNQHKAAQAAKRQSLLLFQKLQQDILTQVDSAVRTTESAFQRIRSTRKAREFAEAALDTEQKKLLNGASTPFMVLELQRNLTTARSAEIRALADYNKFRALLAFHEGSTLEKNQLDVKVK